MGVYKEYPTNAYWMAQVSETVTPNVYFPPFLCNKPLIFSLELGYLELRLSQTPLQLKVTVDQVKVSYVNF